MNKYVSRGLWTVLATGGFLALGVGVAHADTGTSGEDGIASGTQGILGIELPAQLGGNAISILGDADSTGAQNTSASTGAPAADAGTASGGTSGTDSVAGGTQLLPELGIPVTLGGNSISLLGDASSSGSTTTAGGTGDATAASATTDGTDGTVSGTQVLADAGAPVTLGGNAISLLGNASSSDAGTVNGSADAGDQEGSTSGTDGILGGSQVLADAGVPVTLGGNAISLLGDASSSGSTMAAGSGVATAPSGDTDGTDGTLAGTQVLGDVDAPVTLGGNAISLLGDASSDGGDTASGSTAGDTAGGTDGTDGTLGGTQLLADLGVPVTLGGNAISVLGDASTDGPVTDVGTDPGTDPGTGPGTDPGVDPGDDGGDLPTYALAADDVTALAATGPEGGLTALGLAAMLLMVGGVLLARRATAHRR